MRTVQAIIIAATTLLASTSILAALTADEINGAKFEPNSQLNIKTADPLVIKTQVLLARAGVSPGVIDGYDGENYRKAISQFRRQQGLSEGVELDQSVWNLLTTDRSDQIITERTLTSKDLAYRFTPSIPSDYSQQAKMKRLAYKSIKESLSEQHHMDEDLLEALNPNSAYNVRQSIKVVSVQRNVSALKVNRIEANKSTGMLTVFGDGEAIIASYPATIGSDDTPSPAGEHTVTRIAKNPQYDYDPSKNFKQGKNTRKLVLPPGPNNPVGSVWIALSKPTYGIHGTPEPSKVSKTSSHGCIRLTNWDAEELASRIKTGVKVLFVE